MNKNYLKEIIIVHRGIHDNKKVPENSIKAFELALNKNLPIELDIHLLKDNTIVVFHDNNLFRMTRVNKKIKDLTYKELLKYSLINSTYSIPTLDEVLNLVNGKVLLDIEIKNDDRVKDMCNILSNKLDNYQGKFIIKSFYPNIIHWFKVNRPDYIRGILLPIIYKNKSISLLKIKKINLSYTAPNFLAVNKNIIKKNFVIKQRKKGMQIIAWTIKDDKERAALKDYTDGFIVNIKP